VLPPAVRRGMFDVRSWSRKLRHVTVNAAAYTCMGSAYRIAFLYAFLDATAGTSHRKFSRVFTLGAQAVVAMAGGRLQFGEADRERWSLVVPQGRCPNILPHFPSHQYAMHRGALTAVAFIWESYGRHQPLSLYGSDMGDITHGNHLLGANVSDCPTR
jgi:hypothetical protein